VIQLPSIHLAGIGPWIEGYGELAPHELSTGVHVEDEHGVRHRAYIELVTDHERRHIDLLVDRELAKLFQTRHVGGRQHSFRLVPTLARIVNADGPHIDRVRKRHRDQKRRRQQHAGAKWAVHERLRESDTRRSAP
jgi:hypothetical protein